MLRTFPTPVDHSVFVVDPLGNLMMRYDVREDPKGLREDLKLLVMSATLDGARVGKLLGDAPVIESTGRAFPGGYGQMKIRWTGEDTRASQKSKVKTQKGPTGAGKRPAQNGPAASTFLSVPRTG